MGVKYALTALAYVLIRMLSFWTVTLKPFELAIFLFFSLSAKRKSARLIRGNTGDQKKECMFFCSDSGAQLCLDLIGVESKIYIWC